MPATIASNYLSFLDRSFPGWRSVELFGPPGAGKSHICGLLSAYPDIIDTKRPDDDRMVDALSRFNRSAYRRILPLFLRRKFMNLRRRLEASRLRRGFPATLLEDFAIALPHGDRNRPRWEVHHLATTLSTAALSARYGGVRLLIDRGLPDQFVGILQPRRWSKSTPPQRLIDTFIRLLHDYPGDKNALLVTASPSICLARQNARGRTVMTGERAFERYIDACHRVLDHCSAAGWRVALLDNGQPRFVVSDAPALRAPSLARQGSLSQDQPS